MRVTASRTAERLQLGGRDRRIVDLALTKLHGARVDFGEAMRALREAAEELIPGGRVFLLGVTDAGPIVGSILSGIGIVSTEAGIKLVHAKPSGTVTTMDWFAR